MDHVGGKHFGRFPGHSTGEERAEVWGAGTQRNSAPEK